MNNNQEKPLVVFSGVNLVEGGPLSVFKDAIAAFIKHKLSVYRLVVLVKDIHLFEDFTNSGITLIEKKGIKNSYLRRLWFEYASCYFLSRKIKPFLWFALHDITPNVQSIRKAVYCHNPGPFYKASIKEAMLEPTFFLFSKFYKFLYKINIQSNNYVIVQQDWIRAFFIREYKVKHVIVAHPAIPVPVNNSNITIDKTNRLFAFFYPAFPRVFKNFETLLEAANILSQERDDFEVVITMKGDENDYAKSIHKKYHSLKQAKFIGIRSRPEILKLYQETDCLVFPSKLETWGLPISEMKMFNKPILIANEQYAKETAGDYDKVQFFKTVDPKHLANCMNEVLNGTIHFAKVSAQKPSAPYSESWKELLDILLA